jgi:hypothetical protein
MAAARIVEIIPAETVLRLLAQELARDARAPVQWLAPVRDTYTTSIRWTPELALKTLRKALSRMKGATVKVTWTGEPWSDVRASWAAP